MIRLKDDSASAVVVTVIIIEEKNEGAPERVSSPVIEFADVLLLVTKQGD